MAPTTRGSARTTASGSLVVPPPHILAPETPSRSGRSGINDFLHTFGGHFDIELPVNEIISPEKRAQSLAHDVLKKIRPLYFRQPDLLDHAFVDLKARRPPVRDQPNRLHILDQRLNEALSTSILSPHSARRKARSPLETDGEDVPLEAPPSPTLAVKHAPSQDHHSHTALAGLEGAPGPKSATTSFATTTTSFMSDATSGTKASQSTTATSVSASQKEDLLPGETRSAHATKAAVTPWVMETADAAMAVDEDNGNSGFTVPEHHRVKQIPKHGLAPVDIPDSVKSLPFYLAVEAYRVMRIGKLTPAELESQWTSDKSLESLWKMKDEHVKRKRFQKSFQTDYAGHSLCGKLRWSQAKTGPLFELEMHAPRKEDTNAFQRKFGGDRILTVDLPDLDNPPEALKGQRNITKRVLELLTQPHEFLGRTWLQFHAKRKKGPEADPEDASNYQVSFVAVKGMGLQDIDFAHFINFAIPLRENAHQLALKAYSRLDLANSRTRALSHVFDADTIHWIRDIMSDDIADDNTYNDPHLNFSRIPPGMKLLEMTDGCGEVSLEVMRDLQREFGLTYLPSVFQARIGHSKGLWYWMPGSPPGRWIKIRDSQRKLSSILYTGFIPILRDRGVPSQAILVIARDQVNLEGDEFLNALEDVPELQRWLFSQKDVMGTRRATGGKIAETAGFPGVTAERALLMLDSGFEPTKSGYLKKQVLDAAEHVFNLKAKRFKIRLSQSTSLFGIPDMTGTLKPGEIYVRFSQPLKDAKTGQTWASLSGLEVLVARNPALRNADIQKMRCVYKQELEHLEDVVVFSIHGPRPQAGKLSGGDYDGDTFWVCWEPTLVAPFKNAPAPWDLRDVGDFGIVKDTVTLGDMVGTNRDSLPDEAAVRKWIQKGTAARLTESLLSTVTLFHGKLTYRDADVSSEKADLLVDLHDHLVDSDKQGYCLDQRQYNLWRFKHGMVGNFEKPAHWRFTRKNGGGIGVPETQKPGDCIDELFFNTVEPQIKSILLRAQAATKDAKFEDRDLTATYDSMLESRNPVIHDELKQLHMAFQPIHEAWTLGTSRYSKTRDRAEWAEMAEQCRQLLLAIMPVNRSHDTVVEWLRRTDKAPTMWEKLRLSALAKKQNFKSPENIMLFTIAGGELCRIKAQALERSRTVRLDVYTWMKPQKRGEILKVADEDDVEGESDNDETFYEGGSAFDSSDVGALFAGPATMTPPNLKRKPSVSGEDVVKRRQSVSSSPSSVRSRPRAQPTTPVSVGRVRGAGNESNWVTRQRTPKPMSYDWLTGTPPASERPK